MEGQKTVFIKTDKILIDFEEAGKVIFMHLKGDFVGPDETEALRDAFKELSKKENLKVGVDLNDVDYFASPTLGVLLSGNAMFEKKGGKLVFCNLKEYMQFIFKTMKLNLVLTTVGSKDEAIKALDK
jgi:anti-anti-sigma factor